jgi:hypothetical protein
MTTIFDPRTLITRKQVVHPLSKLDSFVADMARTCDEIQEQIVDDAFRTEDPACLREAEVVVEKLDAMIDALMAFQREYVG